MGLEMAWFPPVPPSKETFLGVVDAQADRIAFADTLPSKPCDVAAVFALPALRSLHIDRVVETRRDQGLLPWEFVPGSSNISTLVLTSAALPLQTLSRVLLSCIALEHFAYNGPTDSQVTRDFDLLINALSPFHNTIRTLTFLDQDTWSEEISPIHSLAVFSKLERFSGDAAVLIDLSRSFPEVFPEIFPESLSEMHLVDPTSRVLYDLGGVDSVLEAFAEAKLTYSLKLR
ncbi:hypothetical protein GQ44DRAFT_765568 [Phaeosphaeriaceae sp. PMI808]|nr:hypothetical protein GQ44DRAFT_765568 [Phaeosphaeriaceae sp. PMI808]